MVAGERMWISDERGDRFDRVIEWILIGLLAFMPLAFGVVQAWSEEIVLIGAAAMSICLLLKGIYAKGPPLTWTWAYVPILAFALVALVQAIPLPPTLVRLVSPQTMALKSWLLGDLSSSGTSPSSTTITFYAHATRHDLRIVLAAAAVFVVVLNTIRTSHQIVRLLGAIAIIGAVVAVETLAQAAFGNGKIYWYVPSPHPIVLSGPFVNHSHYAQFMNLSLGAALGLIFVKLDQRFASRSITPATVMEYLRCREGKLLIGLSLFVVVGAASVFVSLSRGGMVSLMIAGAFTLLMVSLRRPLKGSAWIMASLALGAFICVLYTGFDAVYDRLGTLQTLDQAEGGRWQIIKDVAVAWTRFPILGTGLGTHEVVFPMFDRSTVPAIASHAENEYAQAAEETGIVGLMALLVFGVLVWSHYVRVLRAPLTPIRSAAYGLGFGLLAILIHSLSDFGQHLPANALLSVVFCALMIRLAHMGSNAVAATGEVVLASRQARRLGWGGLAVACIVWAMALLDADEARRAEASWRTVVSAEQGLMERNWQGSDEEYVYLLSNAGKARQCDPGNVVYAHWLNVYRWHTMGRMADPNTGDLHLPPEGLEVTNRIVGELKGAILLCPTYGPTWTVCGQLERLILGQDEEGARHIRKGFDLAPYDPIVCLVAGMLRADEGDVDGAFEICRRAVELDERLFPEVASLCVKDLGRPDLSCTLAGDNVDRLIRVEQLIAASGGAAPPVRLSDRIVQLLEQECQGPEASAWKYAWLAQKYRNDGKMEAAIQMYRRALALEYSQVWWRFCLAEILAERGSVPEAVQELKTCVHLQPQFEAARRLLKRLSLQAGAEVSAG